MKRSSILLALWLSACTPQNESGTTSIDPLDREFFANLYGDNLCADDEFPCSDGNCIPASWICDGWEDCLYDEDEARCNCGADEFECANGTCIPGSWECDAWDDCGDGSDETGCNELPEEEDPDPPLTCPAYAEPWATGRVKNRDADEISGLTASRANPGVLWAHNDKGGDNLLYAFSRTGTSLGVFEIDGARNKDWEDLAMGPGPEAGRDYLYIGDLGDNDRERNSVWIYRVPEPWLDTVEDPEDPVRVHLVEAFQLVYEDDRSHNAEALLVDPLTGELTVITRRGSGDDFTLLFTIDAELSGDEPNLLRLVATEEDVPALTRTVTGADLSGDGTFLVTRSKLGETSVWLRPEGAPLLEAFDQPACPCPELAGNVGAVAWSADGRGYYQIPEGERPLIYFVQPVIASPTFGSPELSGHLQAESAREISGLVASRQHPGVLWGHNDSGGGNLLIAFSSSGQHLGDFVLDGAENRDWEDLAMGPGPLPGRDYLYLGDIGDNDLERGSVKIIRFLEPDVDPWNPAAESTVLDEFETFRLKYDDDRSHNAETLLVDPLQGDVYVATKVTGSDDKTRIFRAPAPLQDGTNQLTKMLTQTWAAGLAGVVVGGDVSQDASWIILKFKGDDCRLWHRPLSAPLWEAFQSQAFILPAADGHIEAVALDPQTTGYSMVSEGQTPPIHHVQLDVSD